MEKEVPTAKDNAVVAQTGLAARRNHRRADRQSFEDSTRKNRQNYLSSVCKKEAGDIRGIRGTEEKTSQKVRFFILNGVYLSFFSSSKQTEFMQ